MITAPFNFVPLSEKVFFPDWADKVSHDVPFEDAQSGIIDITIVAKSPIFIRDGQRDQEFCSHNGTYYIPGSSVKGMVRNLLEIMSFSKMSQLNDDTYAVRDLRNRELYMSKMTPDNTLCGFLKKVDGEYYIEDFGKPGRVKHSEIDKIYNINFASKFRHGNFENKAKDKTAKVKYGMIPSDNFEHGFEYLKKDVNREIYRYSKHSTKKGTLVLTGQPSARKEPQGQKPSGKVYEFIFFESRDDIKISKETYENFLFAYFDGRKTEPKESPDWEYWKKKFDKGEKVPVFFQKNGKEIAHFGLSYLYKLPYSHSVKDGMPPVHNDSRKDLAQTIFGYIGKEDALKGRVQLSHFKASNSAKPLEKRTEILGTPRASYYPIYVKQQEGKLFTTFMDGGFNISGWKRYPIHQGSAVKKTTDTGNENVGTTFIPLKEGAIFNGKLRYHNLKKAELGAILSALTFHNTSGCFHNIGMAKSLGYGKIELQLKHTIENPDDCLKAFEVEVSEQVGTWANSEQIKELFSMATEQQNSGNSKLKYMELEQFAKNKTGDKDYLRNYTALQNIKTVTPISLISQEDLEALRERQKEYQEKEKLLQEQRKREEQHQQGWEIVYESTNLATIEDFIKKYPNTRYLAKAQKMIEEIKAKLQQAEQGEAEREAKEKWEAVQKVDKKYYKKALNDFIANYSDSIFVEDAKKELVELGASSQPKTKNQKLDFTQANDAKSIERIMKSVQSPNDEDKDLLEKAIKRIYPSVKNNKKKKNQFMKNSKLMVKWLGQDRFNKIIQELDNSQGKN